ncbi:hypothetical protein QVD17_30392 [Tagetes erecta]|uniref:Uncharacterized protein n=1 Tax=Tagetes erecta TaxID=13708 RepID=A0AAD8K2M9_TARER|nr:hypothetical protein QVD17_30392 [Tagetes erecta]
MMEIVLKQNSTECSPPRKRLLTDLNPKQSFVTESPESTVSFDSSSDRKKTRELPNLSDCHSCGVRINYTNPRERLQPLDSIWRIVLLCKKCTKRVNSSVLCTYCFSAVVDENSCFKCRNCDHSVHKTCVAQYGSGLGLGFSVCVDCWVPDAYAKSIRARKRKLRKKNSEQAVGENVSPSVVEEMERKVSGAAKVSEKAIRKPVVLGVVASRKVAAGCGKKAVDDTKLAYLLHRAINSSPRISRYACLVSSVRRDDARIICYSRRRANKKIVSMNPTSLDVPLLCYSRRRRKVCMRSSAPLNMPLMCYSRRHSGGKGCLHDIDCECFICKASKRTDQHGSTSSAGLKASNLGSNSENNLNENQESHLARNNSESHRYLFKYYRIRKGTPRPSVFVQESDCCSSLDSANLCIDTRNSGNHNESHENSENSDNNTNRFMLKYKRSSRYKPKFTCNVEEFDPMLPSSHSVEPATLSNTRAPSSSQREL